MPDFPTFPVPSSVSAPAIIDEVHKWQSGSGYEIRRSQHSRSRRRYTLEYVGKSTHEMRLIRDFLGTLRGGALPCSWWHGTAPEPVNFVASTPVIVLFGGAHGLVSRQELGIFTSPGGLLNGFWPIQRLNENAVTLTGSTSVGAGPGTARVYIRNMVARFAEDTMPSPVKLIGPEVLTTHSFWNFTILLEEVFA